MISVITNVITVVTGLFQGSGVCLRVTILQGFSTSCLRLSVHLFPPKLLPYCLAPEGPC